MKIWKTLKQVKNWLEYDPPGIDPPKYRPKYTIRSSSSHTSVKFNHDGELVNVVDKTPCYECRKKPFVKVMNRHGYCHYCSTLQAVIDFESDCLDQMKKYRVAHFISDDGIYHPFVWRDGVKYDRLYARYAERDWVLRVINLDGLIEGISVREMSDLERPRGRFVYLNAEWIEEITGDDRD